MRLITLSSAVLALASAVAAATGKAEGFAASVTGGGNGRTVYPSSNSELVNYLGSSEPLNIVLTKTFDFIGSEGTATEDGCLPWGTGSKCQKAINKDNWCGNYQPNAPRTRITYDKAGMLGITVGSNKSIVGQGNKGVIKGKGLRMVSNVKNIIIQNIKITELNPEFVWGGDAITINGADLVWIDHVTTSRIGRQHMVFGNQASGRVTVSNCDIDGRSSWSADCSGNHYWGMYFTGSQDMITFKNNYVHHTSGRSPKVQGNTLLHAVNNYFYSNPGHAFETASGAMVLAEGNVFQNVKATVENGGGQMFSSPDTNTNAQCRSALGRPCQLNAYGSSGKLTGTDTGFLVNFKGKTIAAASTANVAKGVVNTAGYGRV
ncbi:polysaccharide lyase family 1 protein [Emericellopsis cladophorae]|uniref:pectin lyase n=1 Tax=Emericellopsis cladophorae TaxID=2686198 RepID=A0A9P9Y095_9HYPO|nr:polysaccharide lyase family 1 protein [Emericellopsis cladophorae]KAI6780970.1 polysaccharide lyase family 1 protein [Emericellopsis cladophorae]